MTAADEMYRTVKRGSTREERTYDESKQHCCEYGTDETFPRLLGREFNERSPTHEETCTQREWGKWGREEMKRGRESVGGREEGLLYYIMW